MKGFLDELAESLYARHGNELSQWAMIFPSRRARLFFMESLSEIIDRPIWQPQWVSIDDLTREISGLQLGDRLRLITELYKVYSEYHTEQFDKFYFWGEMLLNDFDSIDKYLIDADALFSNLVDIKEIEKKFDYMTDEQKAIIRFWSSLNPDSDGNLTSEQERFLAIWKTLAPIYHKFRMRLQELGIAYGGMIQRSAVEKIEEGKFDFPEQRHYIVAGFNALSECEKRLFKFLKGHADTEFYWDYDNYYVQNSEQEAGMFVRQNREDFPSPAGVEFAHDHLKKKGDDAKLTSISTVSNVAQCKYAARLIQELAGDHWDKNTAVVLTDENLLMPLLYALPSDKAVNITMGYPLRSTMAYTFIERLLELQSHSRKSNAGSLFYYVDVVGLLSHPYVMTPNDKICSRIHADIREQRRIMVDAEWLGQTPLLKTIFRTVDDWQDTSDYLLQVLHEVSQHVEADQTAEYLAVTIEAIVKLRNSLSDCDIELSNSIYTSLLRRHLQTLRIPFEGEPLQGVQVMGILETRNLDFDQVVILSMNDDNFPGNHMSQSSFIPYSLRAAYKMPTPEHHEGVYAYYFYRLIQRAKRVYMLYCSHADERSTGEPSRYIRQLHYESGLPIDRIEVGVDVHLSDTTPIEVPKTKAVMDSLARFVDPHSKAAMSPTALFRYIACPLKFYFASVARLRVDDEISEEIDAPMFGTILHAAAQNIYKPLMDTKHPDHDNPAHALSNAQSDGTIPKAVEAAINKEYLCNENSDSSDYTGNLLLVKDIVGLYLTNGVLPYDIKNPNFTVCGVEHPVTCNFPFKTASGHNLVMKFEGVADRIDRLADGTLRVVDYKTGNPHLDFVGLDSLFHGENAYNFSHVVQILLYCMMLANSESEDFKSSDSVPSLYYVRKMYKSDFSPLLIDKELQKDGVPFSVYREAFEKLIGEVLAEIYNPDKPFTQRNNDKACENCDFNTICGRKKDKKE